MAITSELIGKIGGGMEEKESFSLTGAIGTHVLAEVTVPEGETWMIVAIVDVGATNSSYSPTLSISNNDTRVLAKPNTQIGVASMSGAGTVTLTIQTSGTGSNRAVTLSGTLYVAKL